jgi:hypothetical protein
MRWLMTVLAAVALTACSSGGSTKPLVLGSGTYSEQEFRDRTRTELGAPSGVPFCQSLTGLNDADAADAIIRAQTLPPTQTADRTSQLRAAAIVKEECARILNK